MIFFSVWILVTEPRYVKNIDSSSQKLDYHEERAQAGYQNEYGNMNYPLLGSNYENGMYSNFGPTLGEPTGGYSGKLTKNSDVITRFNKINLDL